LWLAKAQGERQAMAAIAQARAKALARRAASKMQ
jgi:hypothetical protein